MKKLASIAVGVVLLPCAVIGFVAAIVIGSLQFGYLVAVEFLNWVGEE